MDSNCKMAVVCGEDNIKKYSTQKSQFYCLPDQPAGGTNFASYCEGCQSQGLRHFWRKTAAKSDTVGNSFHFHSLWTDWQQTVNRLRRECEQITNRLTTESELAVTYCEQTVEKCEQTEHTVNRLWTECLLFYFNTCTFYIVLSCSLTNKCTIISQIMTLLHVSTLSCHPQGDCNQYLAKLHKYFRCSCW
jgi:hypothetical protein